MINNTAFVHLSLRYENHYCVRPIALIPKEFALRWQIPESSVYEAVGKLKSCNAIAIKSGKLTIEWVDSQQDDDSDNPEKILESQKKLRNPRKNSESSEKRSSKSSVSKGSNTLQTIQTYQTYTDSLSESERESFLEFGKKKASEMPKPPTLISNWIKTHWEDLRSQWEKSQGKVSGIFGSCYAKLLATLIKQYYKIYQ